tara:strand:- start:50321 stop:51037 length:717 start_codon:yes stop_codon:yes gene_type:complete
MKQNQLVGTEPPGNPLSAEIEQLKRKLELLTGKVDAFEAILRSHLSGEIVEVQELSVLYKAQKKAKKQKRLEQKRKGKNYVEPVGLKTQKRPSETLCDNEEDLKEKKRLYREAMLHVHPDKYAMDGDKTDLATELTTRLVAIYQHEDLDALKAFHAHLFSHAELPLKDVLESGKVTLSASPHAYLVQEKEHLEKAIQTLKNKHTYHVLMTYKDPMTFVDELKEYYQDRIQKLRRRTRT